MAILIGRGLDLRRKAVKEKAKEAEEAVKSGGRGEREGKRRKIWKSECLRVNSIAVQF